MSAVEDATPMRAAIQPHFMPLRRRPMRPSNEKRPGPSAAITAATAATTAVYSQPPLNTKNPLPLWSVRAAVVIKPDSSRRRQGAGGPQGDQGPGPDLGRRRHAGVDVSRLAAPGNRTTWSCR